MLKSNKFNLSIKFKMFIIKQAYKSNNNFKSNLYSYSKNFFSNDYNNTDKEIIETDFLIVGGGPAGLSTAIRLGQLNKEFNTQYDITLVEKGEEIGSHVLSGNCFEPSALNELLPGWKDMDSPVKSKVSKDIFKIFISNNSSITIPSYLMPKSISNEGNYIISLSQLCRWLSSQAEDLGVNLFTGFSAKNLVYSESNASNFKSVVGIETNDFGLDKEGKKKDNFNPGNIIKAKQTILAEGCRGNLTELAIKKYSLRNNISNNFTKHESDFSSTKTNNPINLNYSFDKNQHYGIGLKEVWEVNLEKENNFQPGLVQHTVLWPADLNTYCGSFMYHMEPNIIHLGIVFGLDYKDPYLNPYEEFQRLKTHPDIKKYLLNAENISYGSRILNEGGYYSLPKLTFPGGLIVGCAAGMLNVAKIKGTHNAIKSGMLAAESIFEQMMNKKDRFNLSSTTKNKEITQIDNANNDISFVDLDYGQQIKLYQNKFNKSSIFEEMYKSRNFHGAFSKGGLLFGMINSALSTIFNGYEPWKFIPTKRDCDKTMSLRDADKVSIYKSRPSVKKDGKLTFDILENLSKSGTYHDHDEPCHLKVKDDRLPKISYYQYGGPEQRFCPAKVYEYIDVAKSDGSTEKKLQINAQNCLHCKCCSVKTLDEFINWTVPEGSDGPKYTLH